MNKHLSEGTLRAALDGELAVEGLEHLNTCKACQSRMEQVRLQIQPAAKGLSFLAASAEERSPDTQKALKHFYQRNITRKENFMFKRLFASPLMKIGLAVVLILAVVLSIPATRALADQLLNLFRVQQVVVVPVDFTGMKQLTGDGSLGNQLSQLISSSVTVEQKPGDTGHSDGCQPGQPVGRLHRSPASRNDLLETQRREFGGFFIQGGPEQSPGSPERGRALGPGPAPID